MSKKKSWYQDYASWLAKTPIANAIPGANALLNTVANNEGDAARVEGFVSGLPIVGGVLRGIEQARYLEDYYSNTGFWPHYPSLSVGYSGLGQAVGNIGRALSGGSSAGYNVKEGTNDLLSFYNYAYQ